MTFNNIIEADILSTCNALGSEIKGVYEKGTDCTECLKDILRHLKRDNDDHSVLRFLGSIRLLQTDLLPIIKKYNKDKEIFDFTLRILVALTNPALLLYNEDLPEDKISRNVYLQLISYLQDYKNAFNDVSAWNIFYEHLKGLLKIRPKERSSNENLFIERIIILIRNVLHVPPDDSIRKITDDDLNPHDKILQCLHESKINTLLLFMAANEEEHQYCLHILEIVSLMFREHTPHTLASSNETRSNAEKENDLNVLLAARKREQNLKLQKFQSMCKARFNGVYYVKNMKSISDKDYITHRLVERPEDIKFDAKKDARRKPKNKMRAADVDNSRHSTLSIRLFLKKFCVEFLKTYNKIMVSVKRELLRNISEEHDDTYYLWAINYFMEFNRLHNFQPALVSETVTMQSFHHIQTQITNYQEMMLTDKKKTMFWAKRMQLGVSAYKELLETLKEMEKSEDEIVKSSADALIGNVFYVIEYREMLLSLIAHYNEVKFPLSYLAKLVECAHLFLKMLENHSKKHSDIVVQKKQRKKHKKKKKPITANEVSNVDDLLNEQWDVVTSELSKAVQGHRPIPNVTPFDGASALSFEEQKIEVIYKIREALIANQPFEAVGLLRAARELWPEGDSFGSVDIEPEPEFLVLREIHFSNLARPTENNFIETGDVDSDDSDEEAEAMPAFTEQKLAVDEVYEKYASYKVVQPCSLLLANYRKNKPQTNLSLIKLFHRIAWNCKMHALFFQSSIFLTFQKIFHDPDVNCDPIIKEFYRFAKYIMQKFFVVAEKNRKVFVELLFWKGYKEAYELEEGYGTSDSRLKGWTEEEEEELKFLFEENKNIYIEGEDVADIILANLNPRNKTKKQVISALKRLGLIKRVTDLKPEKRKEWLEEEIIDLQELFGVYKDSHSVMGNILDKLQIKRPRKAVIEKLLELNLIKDKNELYNKSRKKGKGSRFMDSDNNSGESEDNLSNEPVLNTDSSGDEDEINFFKNLEAERYAEDRNDMLCTESTQSENKRLPQIWEEHEVMKLTSLFQENHESDNILDILVIGLPRNRQRKVIVEKLLELGLIKDKNEINKKRNLKRTVEKKKKNSKKIPSSVFENNSSDADEYDSSLESDFNEILKPTRKRKLELRLLESSDEDVPLSNASTLNSLKGHKNMPQKPKEKISKLWEEREIIELSQLFQKYKDSNDVISAIMKDLSFKLTKKSLIEKLLEIGLIKDKSEVNKKILLSKGRLSEEAVGKKNFVWGEKEIIELNQLFLEHKDSENALSNIMKTLTFKQPKNNIIKKLIEIGLIKDKSEIMSNSSLNRKSSSKTDVTFNQKSVKRKKLSEEWREEEVLQLTQLYNEYKDGHDIVTNILQGLTVKRQKRQIIEKLLEVRLIKDRKEVTGKKKNLKHFESEQNITNKAVLDDNSQISLNALSHSSDDENVPLSHVAAENDNIDKADTSLQDSEISLQDKIPIIKKDDDKLPLKSNFLKVTRRRTSSNDALYSRVTKRKRLVINSDDSSDDDHDVNLTNELVEKESQEEDIQNYTVPKLQKKKMRLLDDSDDSD